MKRRRHKVRPVQPADREGLPAVVHVAGFSPEYKGNFIASIAALRESCLRSGRPFVLVLPETASERSWTTELLCQGWRVRFLPVNASTLKLARALAKTARMENAGLIHTHFTAYDIPAWLAVRLAGFRGGRAHLVWHVHSELDVSRSFSRKMRNLVKYRLMARRAWVMAVWESSRKGVIQAGAPADRVYMIPNGIDLGRATSANHDSRGLFSAMQVSRSQRVLLMFGLQPLNKGVDLALDAMAKLSRDDPNLVLVIVGREKLQDFVSERLGARRPTWLRVIRPVEHIGELYQLAAVFISASRSEGFPYAVVEAMANALPVVLSDIPGVSWAHQSNGAVFFEPGDSDALVSVLRDVLSWSDEDRKARCADNRQFVASEYNVGVWAERVMDCYAMILAR